MEGCIIIIFPLPPPLYFPPNSQELLDPLYGFSLLKSFYHLIKTAFLRQRKSHCMGAQCFHSQHSHFPIKEGKITEKPLQTFRFTLRKCLSLSFCVNKTVITSYVIGHKQ